MENSKEIYLAWLNSKNQQIREKAFMRVLKENLEGSKMFDFFELLSVNPELIYQNINGLMKQKPQLLPALLQKVCAIKPSSDSEVYGDLMCELAGLATFYMPASVSAAELYRLITDYWPDSHNSDKLVRTLLVCWSANANWKNKILHLLARHPFHSEAALVNYIEKYNPLPYLDKEIFEAVIKDGEGRIGSYVLEKLFVKYGQCVEHVDYIMAQALGNSQSLPTNMSIMVSVFKCKETFPEELICHVTEKLLAVATTCEEPLSRYVRSELIGLLGDWLKSDTERKIALLEDYKNHHPEDKNKIFTLYDDFITGMHATRVEGSVNEKDWFRFLAYKQYGPIARKMIKTAFTEDYIKATLVDAGLLDSFKTYFLVLTVLAYGDEELIAEGQKVLALFDKVEKLHGDIRQYCERLDKILEDKPELCDEVARFVDLNFAFCRCSELEKEAVERVGDLCIKHGLELPKFFKRHKAYLKEYMAQKAEEARILQILEAEL